MYNAVLESNLEIVTRYAHGLPVGYVLPSRDATIYVGVQDFEFKNTRDYPIKIIASYNAAGSLNISIFGTKEEVEYDIEIESIVVEVLEYDTVYIYDDTLEKGTETVTTSGANGKISEAYIIKSLNGEIVEKELISEDTYSAIDEVVSIGTMEDVEIDNE